MPFAKRDGSAENHAPVVSWSGERMKALFLGHFAASVASRILAKVKTPLETSILERRGRCGRSGPVAVGSGNRRRPHLAAFVPAGAAPTPAAIGGSRARSYRHRRGPERCDDLQ